MRNVPGGKPWFSTKRFGYGAGLPIAWQGWTLLLGYIAAMVALGFLAEQADTTVLAGIAVFMALLTAILIVIVKARTDGEWRWRWGDDD
jgi:hypothetical protein